MDQDTAYRVMMGFATGLKVKVSMTRHATDDWRVTIEPAGEPAQELTDVLTARTAYARLRGQMRLPL